MMVHRPATSRGSVGSPYMKVVILAAGVGSRLRSPVPKPLTVLADGRSIMQRQIENLSQFFGQHRFTVVVGFKKDLILEAFPQCSFVYNPFYGDTNTSKSLLKALELTGSESVLWLNGDVVFEPSVLEVLVPHIEQRQSFVSVNTARVGEEEVKYSLDADGFIKDLSKQVVNSPGEAVGINFVASADKSVLIDRLRECADQDYFERGIELAIAQDRSRYLPVDISEHLCIEVDSREDLAQANDMFGG